MEQCYVHGCLSQNVVWGCWVSRVSVLASVMKNWFSNSPEEESNPNSTSKEHHEPGQVIVLWLISVLAKLEVGVLAEVQC